MNARKTRALIKRTKNAAGSYQMLANKLSRRHPYKSITMHGVYSWVTRGVIPNEWWPAMDLIVEEQEK